MHKSIRLASAVSMSAVVMAALTACGSQPLQGSTAPSAYPTYSQGTVSPSYAEYGRVTRIEFIRMQEPGSTTGVGAVIGGIAGGVIGNQVGGGTGRDVARIAGIAGGALAGNAIEKNSNTQIKETYRISVQTDNGASRVYDQSITWDLRVGDRVRIENGQLVRL